MYFIINFIIVSTKKRCLKCNDAQCEHCRCPGYIDCDHKPVFILLYQGEACKRTKYNKRLVCNNCERRKLEQYFFIYSFQQKEKRSII